MSDPAAPWWADVQHLRPREDRAGDATPPPRFRRTGSAAPTPTRRPAPAARPAEDPRDSAVATLEHEIANPWFDDLPEADRATDTGAPAADAPVDAAPSPVWDEALEEAFARTPSWSDDEDWLLPKGADRIENGRRTIEIRGQVDRIVGISAPAETAVATRTGRRRASRGPAERLAGRPDRVAMWAFLLGLLLILIAVLSNPGDAGAATVAAALLSA